MSTAEREFTASRENEMAPIEMLGATKPRGMRYVFGWQNGVFVQDDGAGPYSESALKREEVAADRKPDRDSRTRLILRYRPTDDFEHHGRHFVRLLELERELGTLGVERGGALRAEPDEELRGKIALFKSIQAAREDAFESKWGCGVDDDPLGRDVSARLGLGGMQDFTARP
jgi:hypothetical protein